MHLLIDTTDGGPRVQLIGDSGPDWELLERIAAAGGRTGGGDWTRHEIARLQALAAALGRPVTAWVRHRPQGGPRC